MATQQAKPIIAVTIGDPAGVGPETVVKALAGGSVVQVCRPLIFGDIAVVERAAKVTGASLAFRAVASATEVSEQDVIGVVDLRSGGENSPIGRVSSEGGLAAFAAVERAVTYCLDGEVDAVATAPINKESLREAGVPYLDPHGDTQRSDGIIISADDVHDWDASCLLHDEAPAVQRDRLAHHRAERRELHAGMCQSDATSRIPPDPSWRWLPLTLTVANTECSGTRRSRRSFLQWSGCNGKA